MTLLISASPTANNLSSPPCLIIPFYVIPILQRGTREWDISTCPRPPKESLAGIVPSLKCKKQSEGHTVSFSFRSRPIKLHLCWSEDLPGKEPWGTGDRRRRRGRVGGWSLSLGLSASSPQIAGSSLSFVREWLADVCVGCATTEHLPPPPRSPLNFYLSLF